MPDSDREIELGEVPGRVGLISDANANEEERGSPFRQFLAGGCANILGIVLGLILSWPSPSLVHLAEGDPFFITTDENSWISSLMPLAAIFGPWAAGFSAQTIGRKWSLLIVAAPVILSYILLAVAESVVVVYVGRIIAGFALGWIFTVLPMYSGEVAENKYRGALGSLIQFSISIGLLLDYVIGPYMAFKWLSVISIVFPTIFMVLFFFVPETPHYLLQKNRDEDAKKALMWLRSKSAAAVATELKIIKTEVEENAQQSGGIKDILAVRTNLKAVCLCVGLLFFQQFSGINTVLFNAQSIFQRSGGSITPDVATIITGVVLLIAAGPTPILVEKLGRKVLLITSGIGMAVSLGVLGACFYMDEQGTDTSGFTWLPIVSVLAFLTFYSPGFGPLPWAVMGEMFPGSIKSMGSTICASFAWVFGFLVTRFYNDLVLAMGDGWTFWFFAIFCAISAPFVYFLVPETKGKTVAEIHLELR